MIGFDEAQALLAANVSALGTERVMLAETHGRVLAEPVHAAICSPRVAVSAMDGYALRNADAALGGRFAIVGKSFAGDPPPVSIASGQCARIFTGAALPAGADRVVMQENCIAEGDEMTIAAPFGPARHVRVKASDFAEGDLLLPAGALLNPRAIVALAGADHAEALVYKRPKLAIIATGDELAAPGRTRDEPGKIPESVSFGAAAMAQDYGATMAGRFVGGDDLPTLRGLAERALSTADVVVVIGGAAVGERDYGKAMFDEQKLELLFSHVAIKPGKPIWVGRAQGRWVVGLPGNPTSAMVTARVFLVPLLTLLQGCGVEEVLTWIRLPLAGPNIRSEGRTIFARACMTNQKLKFIENQDSGAQAPLVRANWLVRCDPEDREPPTQRPFETGLALQF